MKHYGLIGKRLGHSWSAEYFGAKFMREGIEADYRLTELPELTQEAVERLNDELNGYNVTIPYKEAIIPFLRALDPVAAEIGAVNVVNNGVGYNTDWLGFKKALSEACDGKPEKALVLGRGGAAKAVKYALASSGIEVEMISARGTIVADLGAYGLIVNATPLGMWPDIAGCPNIDYAALTPKHILFDCVYNPEETEFIRRGKAHDATVIGGRRMLEIQAEESWNIWNN